MRRWEELRTDLDAHEIQLVTICTDTPAQLRKGHPKHGAKAVMLSDPHLEITNLYNLRNDNAVRPTGFGSLPIPTTILVDAEGIVRWIDQADDYMIRSAPERVLAAVNEAFA